MDILNTIQSALGGGDKKDDLMSTVMELLGGQGGLQNLISQFDSKGLGDIIGSWVSTGQNKSISPDQIKNVFGSDTLSGIASKLGVNVNELSGQLSNLLPDVVDKLTPNGKVPEGDILGQASDLLGGLFGKK
ncbi:Ribosomal protein P2 [Ignavibacterium album JCM 16511]|uniref:Ribosomal protein P2 n=1 Tax=Ignavibacterium album (strain DSM 19864 / JCM 16511 / NBRC 101810 / Mat9-16) TaxID=945713 RepID=I0AFK6_IGNAJ|nr:YidB family protein [Ignavibacterium album]AFH47763.1 Ribosomal protein P2 [Ignavibacterium album JCM 16511]